MRGLANDQTSSQFDRIIHDRIRLAILSSLAVNEKLTFKEMKQLLDVTDGNLSVHARKLEEAGYINVSKILRRKDAQNRIPANQSRPKGTRRLPEPYGSFDSRHA